MTPEQTARYVDAAAAALDLPLSPEHRPGVLQFFALAAGFAEQLRAVPLNAHDDPAPMFAPVEPAPSTAGSIE